MAVASASKDKNQLSESMESSPSDSATTKPDLVSISRSSSISISGLEELGNQSNRSDQGELPMQNRKDQEIQFPLSSRSEEYRQLFHLPPEEVLVQDFNCALLDTILLQGHMYLFLHHICFYSNIFGFETKKSIPFYEVTCVRKAKTAGLFPNAIEIVAGERKNFFASFLSRDEAYRLIVDGLSQRSNVKWLLDCQESKSDANSQHDVLVLFGGVKPFNQPGDNSMDRNKGAQISEEHRHVFDNGDNIGELIGERFPEVQESGEGENEAVAQAECSFFVESLIWKPEDVSAPKIPSYYTMVAESKFPIQVKRFFSLFFSDSSVDFIRTFHKKCGDRNFDCSRWYVHEQFGHARDVTFEHPIKFYFGAKFANCQEVQKFRVYRDGHLVIETSQQMNDVPYGDYFRVEGLWDLEKEDSDEKECCTLRIYTNVSFSKKTMWKGKIEQSTAEECREAYSIWINNAHELLKQKESVAKIQGVASLAVNGMQNNDVVVESVARFPSQTSFEGSIKNVIPKIDRTVEGGLNGDNSVASLFRESFASFYMYLKNQNHFPLILVIAIVSIIVLMQLSIIVLLTINPRINLIPQESYVSNLGSNRAEAIAWLEKRIYHLKDEMLMVEARLEKMHHEYQSLKAHLQGLERLRSKS